MRQKFTTGSYACGASRSNAGTGRLFVHIHGVSLMS